VSVAAVDTNVISYIANGDTRGLIYEKILDEYSLHFLSFATIVELEYGMQKRGWGLAKRRRLENYLRFFAVYHTDADLCAQYVETKLDCESKGRPVAA